MMPTLALLPFSANTYFLMKNLFHIFTCLVVFVLLFLVEATSLKTPKAPSFQIRPGWYWTEVSFHANTPPLSVSDFRFSVTFSGWRSWRHFRQKSAATWEANTKRMRRAYASASASFWSQAG